MRSFTPQITRTGLLFFLLIVLMGQQQTVAQQITTHQQGRLVIDKGIPVLTVKGSHYQMGQQYGTLLNAQLVQMDRLVDSLIAANTGDFFLKRWLGKVVLKNRLRKIDQRMPACFIRELEGIAETSDLSVTDIKTIAYFPQVFFEISCTSFIMKEGNAFLHGRNLDWNGIDPLVRFPLLVNYHPDKGNAFTVATFIGYPGVYTAMNHQGLSISINMNGANLPEAMDADGFNQAMPSAYKTRQLMEQATSLRQVDSLLRNYVTHGWFFTVGSLSDREGRVYELTRGKIFKNEMHGDFLAIENLSLAQATRKPLTPIWEHSTSNTAREAKIHELYQDLTEMNLTEKAYLMLSNVSFYREDHHPAYFIGINNGSTVQSCILDLSHQALYFAYAPGLAGLSRYYRYNIPTQNLQVFKEPEEKHMQALRQFKALRSALYEHGVASKKREANYYSKALAIIDEADVAAGVKAYYRGIYLTNNNDYGAAIDEFRKLTQLHPAYEYGWYYLAKLMRKENRLNEAAHVLEQMEALPSLSRYYQYRGQIERILLTLQTYKKGSATIEQVNLERKRLNELLRDFFIDSSTQKLLQELDKKIEEAGYE